MYDTIDKWSIVCYTYKYESAFKHKHKNKHMRRERLLFDTHNTAECASVYYYLLAGISLVIAVFLFLPRIVVG